MKVAGKIYEKDTMTSEQRLQAVINLQVPDRVPSCPFIYYFAAYYTGITVHELWSNPRSYRKALDKCYEDLGPWDVHYPVNPIYPEVYTFIMPMKARWPGIDLPPDSICQLLEEEIMRVEDYQWIGELAAKIPKLTYIPFFLRMISRAWDNVEEGWKSYAYILPRLLVVLANWRYDFWLWNKRGVSILYGFPPEAAYDTFSLARGFLNIARDMRNRPQEIAKAADDLTEGYIFISRLIAGLMGVKRIEIWVHRSSSDFISPDHFKKLSFPSLKALVEGLVAVGINPILHCDGNWDLNLETLRELPSGNCVIQFDGPTNIFLAKEVLGDRVCIMGDVPSNMLALGSPTEVDEYCHRLIEEVGKGGGYIMGAGCEIPPNARPENVKALIDSVVKYGYY
jgi:hypothetical protein